MRPLKLILTASGCPGAATVIRHLKDNGEREVEIIGTDTDVDKIGVKWCDMFYKVPSGDSPEFIPRLLEIVNREKPDVLLPQSSAEVHAIAKQKDAIEKLGTKVMISSPAAVDNSENKLNLYRKLQKIGVKSPEFYLPESLDDFVEKAGKLGYPERRVCFKPPISKGTRGFRIITSDVPRREILLYYRPFNRLITMREFIEIFDTDEPFPELILMEYIEGMEYTTDPLLRNGEVLLCPVKTREKERCGLAMKFRLVDRPALVETTRLVCRTLGLDWLVNLQFIEDVLIEVNPRLSTFVFQPELNQPYLAIKLALGEISKEQVRAYESRIQYGRTSIRYYDQVFFN